MTKVLIRADASNTIGMGHINRCLSLARQMEDEEIESLFVLKYVSDNVAEDYQKLGINIVFLAEDCSLDDEVHFIIEHFASQYSVVLFDFSHYQNMERIQDFVPYFEALQNAFTQTFLIDGFNDTAIINYIDPAMDVVITPYIGAKDHSTDKSIGYRHWTGPSYFIFAPEYLSENWYREVPSTIECLLITMGGSDPCELTLVVLDALKLLPENIHCRVVIGSGFSDDLNEKVKKQCFSLPLCEIVNAPQNLAAHLKWAEMAISASGLTKYEMALTGVPSLQLSPNSELAETTATYEKEGFYKDLGLYTERTPQGIAEDIVALAKNSKKRRDMIEHGQALFVEPGIKRLINAIRGC
jgi:UDP-2,4-diacetamido-2,4,6-trideoxy-beta-L-altropyranose hydrolase